MVLSSENGKKNNEEKRRYWVSGTEVVEESKAAWYKGIKDIYTADFFITHDNTYVLFYLVGISFEYIYVIRILKITN